MTLTEQPNLYNLTSERIYFQVDGVDITKPIVLVLKKGSTEIVKLQKYAKVDGGNIVFDIANYIKALVGEFEMDVTIEDNYRVDFTAFNVSFFENINGVLSNEIVATEFKAVKGSSKDFIFDSFNSWLNDINIATTNTKYKISQHHYLGGSYFGMDLSKLMGLEMGSTVYLKDGSSYNVSGGNYFGEKAVFSFYRQVQYYDNMQGEIDKIRIYPDVQPSLYIEYTIIDDHNATQIFFINEFNTLDSFTFFGKQSELFDIKTFKTKVLESERLNLNDEITNITSNDKIKLNTGYLSTIEEINLLKAFINSKKHWMVINNNFLPLMLNTRKLVTPLINNYDPINYELEFTNYQYNF